MNEKEQRNMSINLLSGNAPARDRHTSFVADVYVLSSQALHRANLLAVTLGGHVERDRIIAPGDVRKKALYDEMDRRFEALLDTIAELKAIAARQATR
jgi:hypothetical protein